MYYRTVCMSLVAGILYKVGAAAVAISQNDRTLSSPQPFFSAPARTSRLWSILTLEKHRPALIPYIDPKNFNICLMLVLARLHLLLHTL
jgi:hypothetical protein